MVKPPLISLWDELQHSIGLDLSDTETMERAVNRGRELEQLLVVANRVLSTRPEYGHNGAMHELHALVEELSK